MAARELTEPGKSMAGHQFIGFAGRIIRDLLLPAQSRSTARTRLRSWMEVFGSLAIGVAAFLAVVGPRPLSPTNILWLKDYDPATNYLGWAFFRSAPWSWPIAANPRYGMDISASILMSDANPLFAFPFKALDSLLPQPFQYFGFWLLACFALQAYFSYLIVSKYLPRTEQRLLAVTLFVFSPPFLARLAAPTFHITLAGQWEILAAIWLYLSPDTPKRTLKWALLIACGVLTHPYLLSMTATIFIADVMKTLIANRPLAALGNAGAVGLTALSTAMTSGVFFVQPSSVQDHRLSSAVVVIEGFNWFKFNLASPINPQGWSYFLPTLPSWGAGELEGYAYLGAGLLLLAAAAIILLYRQTAKLPKFDVQHLPLALVLIGLVFFAASERVSLTRYSLHLPWPHPLLFLGEHFRGTGRFIWPVFYLGVVAVVWTIAQLRNQAAITALFVAAALIQVIDTSAGWRHFGPVFAQVGPAWPTSMKAGFWKAAAHRYASIRLAVPQNGSPMYKDLAYYALENGLETDAIYLARYDATAFGYIAKREAGYDAKGQYDPHSLWILDKSTFGDLQSRDKNKSDFIGIVDGYRVLAPGFTNQGSAM